MTRLDTSVLPGFFNGLPFKGTVVPNLKSEDSPARMPTLATDAKIKVFKSNNAEDMLEYAKVIEKITAGMAMPGVKRVIYEKDEKAFLIYLEWAEFSYVDPVDNSQTPVRLIENKKLTSGDAE